MKHVIIFPFWNENEVKTLDLLSKNWNYFANEHMEYEFLLLARSDYEGDIQFLIDQFSKIKPTKFHKCTSLIRTHYSKNLNATNMFLDASEHITSRYIEDGGFFLWFEADMLPCNKNWLSQIDQEWSENKPTIMGFQVTRERLNTNFLFTEHINGGACYSKNLFSLINKEKVIENGVFDLAISPSLRSKGHKIHDSHLWDLRIDAKCQAIRMDEPLNKNKAIVHGIKTFDLYSEFLGELINDQ